MGDVANASLSWRNSNPSCLGVYVCLCLSMFAHWLHLTAYNCRCEATERLLPLNCLPPCAFLLVCDAGGWPWLMSTGKPKVANTSVSGSTPPTKKHKHKPELIFLRPVQPETFPANQLNSSQTRHIYIYICMSNMVWQKLLTISMWPALCWPACFHDASVTSLVVPHTTHAGQSPKV